MGQKKKASQPSSKTLPKAATGIQGLDEITAGGLPRGRPTLVSGGAGSGKTLFGLEFLVRGATQFSEPGVFISFEESIPDLTKNVASLGFDLDRLVADKKLFVDHVSITRSELGETGEYDLDGLFIRIADAVQRVGARRIVLDTIEALFGELPNPGIVHAEIRRLFNWLKQKGLTTVITAERDQPDRLTRHGIEEFVSDCVILLDHRIREEISTRRLRIVKYRGSTHGTNEYPFLIDDHGISVLPISSRGLNHAAPAERVQSGIARVDGMLGGKGFYRGAAFWHPAPREPVKPPLRHVSWMRPAAAAIAPCFSLSKNHPSRSSAICVRSASTSSHGSAKGSCNSMRRVPLTGGSNRSC